MKSVTWAMKETEKKKFKKIKINQKNNLFFFFQIRELDDYLFAFAQQKW